QYTYARIQSILRKVDFEYTASVADYELNDKERELIKQLETFPEIVLQAAHQHSPALVANYTYELVGDINSFDQNVSIMGVEDRKQRIFRIQLSKHVARIIKTAFALLGIDVPERM